MTGSATAGDRNRARAAARPGYDPRMRGRRLIRRLLLGGDVSVSPDVLVGRPGTAAPPRPVLSASGVVLYDDCHTASLGGETVVLSFLSWLILRALAEQAPGVVGKDEIARAIALRNPADVDAQVRGCVSVLRRELRAQGLADTIERVMLVGYRLRTAGHEAPE
jgi:DNA-binding response OmpR family regulator